MALVKIQYSKNEGVKLDGQMSIVRRQERILIMKPLKILYNKSVSKSAVTLVLHHIFLSSEQ